MINKIYLFIKKLSNYNSLEKQNKISQKIEKKIKYSALIISIIPYILSAIRLLTHRDPYGLICLLLLTFSFFSFIVFSQYVNINFSTKGKKVVNFFANYTYSLFLIQYSAGYILSMLRVKANTDFLIFLIYLLSNGMAIVIALLTEMRSSKLNNYLIRIFNLN